MNKQVIHIICGPTASGKSAHALKAAENLNGVIINADSMQIYDGLPLLTAQPSRADKELFPHRLYGHLHPNESCSAGNWREMVEPLIHEILDAGQTPIICGGSGLYIKALTEGLSPIPDIPDDVRDKTNAHYKALGKDEFFKDLQRRDPIMAARLHSDHKARIIRAWEVIEATGKSLAEWQEMPRLGPPAHWQFNVTIVMPERETLYSRCDQRFLWMMDNGALEELEQFNAAKSSGEISEKALLNHALGVKPLTNYLDGEIDKQTAITLGQGETRRYAKRQVTWFKHQIKENDNISVSIKN